MGFAQLLLVEPNISEVPDGFDTQHTNLVDLKFAVTKADIVVLLVDHVSFKEMDLGWISGKQIVDTRGIWI